MITTSSSYGLLYVTWYFKTLLDVSSSLLLGSSLLPPEAMI